MNHKLLILCTIATFLMAGCQSTAVVKIEADSSFNDELFPDYGTYKIETEQEVFAISPSMEAFVNDKINKFHDTDNQIKALADGIFDHSDLNLLYKNDANTVANVTFINRAANCLSLTIMTFVMADYANFAVNFQQVDTQELWIRRDGNNLLNRHVNLRLYKKTKSNIILFKANSYQLDFDRRAQSMRLPAKKIDKKRVLAMFYSNKGADALIKGNFSKSYAYFRSAILTDPQMIEAWTNLGILYRRSGHVILAEETYLRALTLNKNDATTLENLALVYAKTGRQEQAQRILTKIEIRRMNNPYYHFLLGEEAFDKKDWKSALKYYKKSIKLNKKQHHFYFALAKTYFKLGDIDSSERSMKLAKKYSQVENLQLLYQGKLERLQDL